MTDKEGNELQTIEFRANNVHFLKLVRNMQSKQYFLMLRGVHDKAEDAIICSKAYVKKGSGLRALSRMHEKLCAAEKAGEAKGVAKNDYRVL